MEILSIKEQPDSLDTPAANICDNQADEKMFQLHFAQWLKRRGIKSSVIWVYISALKQLEVVLSRSGILTDTGLFLMDFDQLQNISSSLKVNNASEEREPPISVAFSQYIQFRKEKDTVPLQANDFSVLTHPTQTIEETSGLSFPVSNSSLASKLSDDLSRLLEGDDLTLLRRQLLQEGILTREQLEKIHLWKFMNLYNLYTINERQKVLILIRDRMKGKFEPQETPRFHLKTVLSSYFGNTPSEAFAAFCEKLAQKYPLKFRSLIGNQYDGNGKVVLFFNNRSGDFLQLTDPPVYVDSHLTEKEVVLFGQWLCRQCGETDMPFNDSLTEPQILQPTESKSASSTEPDSPSPVAEKPITESPPNLTQKMEEIILARDLNGISLTDLAREINTGEETVRSIIRESKHIVEFPDKLIHEAAFVDREEGANHLEEILEKQFDKNHGYISSDLLYRCAHTEMYLFLNDNGLDNAPAVYYLAKHLFEKVRYHGKRYLFRMDTHISRDASGGVTSNI